MMTEECYALVQQTVPLYSKASLARKGHLLDELVVHTGGDSLVSHLVAQPSSPSMRSSEKDSTVCVW